MSAIRRFVTPKAETCNTQMNQQDRNMPFYVKPQNRETYFKRSKSNELPSFNEDNIEKEIKQLCIKNAELKNDAIVYPYGYDIYKIITSEPHHFPQLLFGNYAGKDKSSYQSAVFEIKINHTPYQINNLTIDLLSKQGDLILTYKNHVIIPMTNSFHVIVDKEKHYIDLFNYSLPIHKACKDINRNFTNIKNHKKWLRIRFNDGKNEYIIKSPVFCLSSTCFRGPLKGVNKNINSIKKMHSSILSIVDNETIFRTGALRNAQEISDELDAFISEAEESVSKIRPLQIDPLDAFISETEELVSKILPIQSNSIKRPIIDHTSKMIIPESVLSVSHRWNQMTEFFNLNNLAANICNMFTNTFLHSNVTKLFSSKYYGGIMNGMLLLTIIKNSPGGYGTIILSKTQYSNYFIWVIRTIDKNTNEVEGGEEGEIQIVSNYRCNIGFYIFNPKFEGMLENMLRCFPNKSPFKICDPEILIDTTPSINIDTIHAVWKNEGIKPLIL